MMSRLGEALSLLEQQGFGLQAAILSTETDVKKALFEQLQAG